MIKAIKLILSRVVILLRERVIRRLAGDHENRFINAPLSWRMSTPKKPEPRYRMPNYSPRSNKKRSG